VSSTPMVNVPPEAQSPSGPRLKLIIGVAVVILAIGYLVVSSVSSSSAYYMTIGELKAAGQSRQDRKVRVAGELIGDTVKWDARQIKLDFVIADGSEQLPVSYSGARPDMFRDGAETIVEGTYADGLFRATDLLLKCPSKYEEATSAGGDK